MKTTGGFCNPLSGGDLDQCDGGFRSQPEVRSSKINTFWGRNLGSFWIMKSDFHSSRFKFISAPQTSIVGGNHAVKPCWLWRRHSCLCVCLSQLKAPFVVNQWLLVFSGCDGKVRVESGRGDGSHWRGQGQPTCCCYKYVSHLPNVPWGFTHWPALTHKSQHSSAVTQYPKPSSLADFLDSSTLPVPGLRCQTSPPLIVYKYSWTKPNHLSVGQNSIFQNFTQWPRDGLEGE